MANTITHKQSSTPSKVPTTSDLALGELGVNTFDGKLFLKKDNGTASIVEIGAGSGGVSYSTGMMMMYAGATAPTGWLLADGTAVSRTTYSVLFTLISTTYGTGDGSTTFNLPDLRRRIPMGKGASDSLGDSDGAAYASRNLTHSHSVPAHYHGMGAGADLNITSSGTHTTAISHDHASFNVTGGTHAHAVTINVQQSATVGTGTRIPASGAGSSIASGNPVNWGDDGSHTHAIDVPAFTGNSASDGAHTHALSSISGSIGLVTGGVSGNALMTSGTVTQPYLIINHIIKY